MTRMSTLPASVRLSLWITTAWAGRTSVPEALAAALPDVDDVAGDVDRLTLWGELGERVLVAALPRPGDLTALPQGDPAFASAAAAAGECVYVPALGGALVPVVDRYGPRTDEGWQVTLTAYDCDPTPVHRLEALDESHVERTLRERLLAATSALEGLDVQPFAGSSMREVADDRLAAGRWGLPDGLPGRAARTIQLAGTVAAAAQLGLDAQAYDRQFYGPAFKLLDEPGACDRIGPRAQPLIARLKAMGGGTTPLSRSQ